MRPTNLNFCRDLMTGVEYTSHSRTIHKEKSVKGTRRISVSTVCGRCGKITEQHYRPCRNYDEGES